MTKNKLRQIPSQIVMIIMTDNGSIMQWTQRSTILPSKNYQNVEIEAKKGPESRLSTGIMNKF